MAKTVKVAILGGGMAGVAAAWTLVHNPPPDVTFDVTLYEASWRLGGKCASGRKTSDGSYRIEEHGIHVLLGFYSQVLRILRDCYAEVGPMGLGFPPFAQALEPSDLLQLPDEINGTWTFWPLTFPSNAQKPGDADPTKRDFLGALLQAGTTLAAWVQQYEAQIASNTGFGATLGAAVPPPGGSPASTLAGLLQLPPLLLGILAIPPNPATTSITVRHLWMAIYFGATNLLGILEWGLFTPEAFQDPTLNAMDYKVWLQSIGPALPSPELTWDSPIVNAVYDLCFSRAVGFAAGAALYDTMMMLLLYAGHVFYRMAGTGDVVFAPLYFALAAKGVQFRFQHVVTDVHVGPPSPTGQQVVDRIELTGDGLARPVTDLFVNPSGQYWWPDVARFPPATTPMTLVQGTDFDHVICAIPIGALTSSAPSVAALPPVATAIARIITVPTESIQLWLDKTPAQLGWTYGRMMLGSFDRPFNSCADMAQVLPTESFPGEQGVLYMSDVYTGTSTNPLVALQDVTNDAVAWVTRSLPTLLPQFQWSDLVDPSGASGSNRIAAQYLRANVTGTELYVASAPGTVAARLPADGAGVENLFLASDWVITEENQGCVEGAARSGVTAAEALSVRASLPLYVQNDDDWVFPGPVVLAGCTAQAFPFLADPAALAALCARYSVDGVTVTPWAVPLVLVFGARSDDIASTDPVYASFGTLSEREVGVFVPVNVQTATRSFVALLCPYLFVDNGATLIAGREIYGLPKELASFPPWPTGGGVPFPLTVTSLALPTRGALATPLPVLTVHQLLGIPPILPWNPGAILTQLWQDILNADSSVTLVALKQFHAIEDGPSACYRALVECRIVPTFRSWSVDPGVWTITLPPHFFPTPSATLGLASGSVTLVSVQAALDFTLTLGDVIAS
jgi:uncharacterized protein with NAD-binding domain and iron-sulfur cluster